MLSLKSKCLNNLFIFFNKEEIDYAVVGDSALLPSVISSDIDIVIRNEDLGVIENKIVQFSIKNNCRLVQVLQHEHTAFYFVLSIFKDEGKAEYIHPDICGDYLRNGKPLLLASELLEGRILARSKDGTSKGFYVLSPEKEFIYYLVKKIDKGALNQEQFIHLVTHYNLARNKCNDWLLRFWSSEQTEKIISWLNGADIEKIQALLPQLQDEIAKRNSPAFSGYLHETSRKISRVAQPTGLVICFLGADGAGKTAVGDRLQEELAPAFRRFQRFHLRPYLLGTAGDGVAVPVTDPHGKPVRSVLASMAKLAYFWLDYTFGYWLKVRSLKVRSTLVVFDRYYHDLLIDPKRYRYGAPAWMARMIGKLIPKPDLFIILDAPADVINARKQEVSLAETTRQREAYLAFARNQKNCIVLNTHQSLDKTAHEGYMEIMEYMQKRQAKRIGINDAR